MNKDIRTVLIDVGLKYITNPLWNSKKNDEVIDATLKALSTIVLSEKKLDEPCPRGDYTGNCDDDYDSGWENGEFVGYNNAIDHISQMILGEKGS